VSIYRYRYLDETTRVVELLRIPIKLKPFLSDVAATIDLEEIGNEYPPDISPLRRYRQRLSIIPVDESQLFGDNYEGQFIPYNGSVYDVAVNHTVYKDDLRIVKRLWSFEINIPALSGLSVTARFKGRLKRGRFTTVLKGEGMWKHYEGGARGDLYVELIVK
jgi:hypothetical protein